LSRDGFRRKLREAGPLSLKMHAKKRSEGEIMQIAKTPVLTMAPTTPIEDAIRLLSKEGFRRIPIASPATKLLVGILTATDIVDYLGGGKRFDIIQQKHAGNYFKAISEPVKIVMNQTVVSIKSSAKIRDALELMKKENVGGLPVVDDQNRVKAIVTERDIATLFSDRLSGVKVAQIMSDNIVTALPKTTVFEAEKTMSGQGFRRLPIVVDGKVVGIITSMDIVRFFGSGQVYKYLRSGTLGQVLSTPALEIATKHVSTISPDADIGQAAKVMREKRIGAIPVVESDKLVGIITERDFFKVIE
jgi:CBS domain-containing protein